MKRTTSLGCLALLLTLAGQAHAQQSCSQLVTLIDQAIGAEAGNAALVTQMYSGLDAWTSDGLSKRFDAGATGEVTGDRFRRNRSCSSTKERRANSRAYRCRFSSKADAHIVLDADMPTGQVTYLNPGRRYLGAVENQISPETAKATAIQLAEALGVPAAEVGSDFATVAERVRVTATRGNPMSKVTRRSEVFVKLPRLVNGFPVHGSDARVAIDVAGMPARAYVDWADFAPAAPLSAMRALSRSEIVDRIAEELGDLAPCGHFGRMVAKVGWIEAPLPGYGEIPTGRYIPGVRVLAISSDSLPAGHLSGPTHDLVFPIVEAIDSDSAS